MSSEGASSSAASVEAEEEAGEKPLVVVVLGMAGAGKTSLVHRLTSELYSSRCPPYVINLDPAVRDVKYPANIDIRDTVKYKEVMREYKMGPNGAIMTSLNLFATKFDQVLRLLQKRKKETKYVILDTPGQIEVFTWSASGAIITEALCGWFPASEYPTVIAYVMDAERNTSPTTFMSNMLYACSILYKTQLPFVVVLNKADVVDPSFAVTWMRDWEVFQEALAADDSYSSDLARSLSLVLDEFYAGLASVPVSARTGSGVQELFAAFDKAKAEYETDYRPLYERLRKAKADAEVAEQEGRLARVKLDIQKDRKDFPELYTRSQLVQREAASRGIRGLGVEVGSAADDVAAEEREPHSDEDDEDEKRELESFRRFLKAAKDAEAVEKTKK